MRSRWSTAWLAIAVALTGATQLRSSELPIGPGELLLAAWCGAAVIGEIASRAPSLYRSAIPVLGFWGVSSIVLVLGLILNQTVGGQQSISHHATIAYLFAAVVSAALAAWATDEWIQMLARWLVAVLVVALTALWLLAMSGFELHVIDPWYSIRFTGWSTNPNQVAIQLVAVPPLSLYFARRSRRAPARWLWLATLPISVIVGIATQSDALTVSWLACASVFVAVELITQRRSGSERATLVDFGRFIVLPTAGLVALLLVGVESYGRFFRHAQQMYEYGEQGSVRVALWMNGIHAALMNPLIGLGPGAHSGVTMPLQGVESHNSFIDWWSNFGLIGLTAYAVMLFHLGRTVVRCGESTIMAAFAGLLSVSVFHYTFRQPIYWVGLIAIAGLAASELASKRESSG